MADPFKITEPTCISFSGGRTSAFMLWRVIQSGGGQLPCQAVVCFANTGKEDEATLKFVQDCSDNWNVPIAWIEYQQEEPGFKIVNFETAGREGQAFESLLTKKSKYLRPISLIITTRLWPLELSILFISMPVSRLP
jgi:3'-phosphoadenosine 5'-phosphosulfate sulfotransferase (PAPS reductase)/FAD synthetase